jgi:hypothetical protein
VEENPTDGWDEAPSDEPTPEPMPYKPITRTIGIQFKPVPPDRDVLWDIDEA